MVDPDGGVYFTYFGDPLLGRLDPKTGAVTSYPGADPQGECRQGHAEPRPRQ